jgi:hypothetical protein
MMSMFKDNPNIVHVLGEYDDDCCKADNQQPPAIYMQHIKGQTLEAAIEDWATNTVCTLYIPLCLGYNSVVVRLLHCT